MNFEKPITMRKPITLGGVPFFLLVGIAFFVAFSAWMFYPSWERAFRSDGSPVAWLSSALLLSLSVIALRLISEGFLPAKLGWWLVVSFFALALDEQFMLHELWKFKCHEWVPVCRESMVGASASYWVREMPMLLVGLFGSATITLLYRALPKGTSRVLLLAGLAVGLFAIGVDQWIGVPEELAVFEEVFEVAAEALVLAALIGLRGA
jgi:hypothetical protein